MIYTCLQCNRRLRIRPENKKHGHTFRCPHCKTQQWLIINWFSKRLSLEDPNKSESDGSSEANRKKDKKGKRKLVNELWNINNHFEEPDESIDGLFRGKLYSEEKQMDCGFVEIQKVKGKINVTYYEIIDFFTVKELTEDKSKTLQSYKDAIEMINNSEFVLQPGWEKVENPFWKDNNGLISNRYRKEGIHKEFHENKKVSAHRMKRMFDEMNNFSSNAAHTARVKILYNSWDEYSFVESVCLDGIVRFRTLDDYKNYGIVIKANDIGYAALLEIVDDTVSFSIYNQLLRMDIVFGTLIKATFHFMTMDKKGYFSIDDNNYVSEN